MWLIQNFKWDIANGEKNSCENAHLLNISILNAKLHEIVFNGLRKVGLTNCVNGKSKFVQTFSSKGACIHLSSVQIQNKIFRFYKWIISSKEH
jgi:hypothetical protein